MEKKGEESERVMGASKHSCLLLALVFLDLSLAFTPSIVSSRHHGFVAIHSARVQRSALRRARVHQLIMQQRPEDRKELHGKKVPQRNDGCTLAPCMS